MDLTRAVIKVADHVKFTVVEREAIIIDTDSGKYLGLDEVGTRILEILSETGSAERVIQTLMKEYSVSEAQLKQDVEKFIEEFETRGLVEIREE